MITDSTLLLPVRCSLERACVSNPLQWENSSMTTLTLGQVGLFIFTLPAITHCFHFSFVDTQGQLHRDEISDFTGQSNYVVKQEMAGGIIYAHIIFYLSVATQPYAEVCCLFYFLFH